MEFDLSINTNCWCNSHFQINYISTSTSFKWLSICWGIICLLSYSTFEHWNYHDNNSTYGGDRLTLPRVKYWRVLLWHQWVCMTSHWWGKHFFNILSVSCQNGGATNLWELHLDKPDNMSIMLLTIYLSLLGIVYCVVWLGSTNQQLMTTTL